MHSMMDLVMTSPSPVPFSRAALWSEGWQKGTNSVCCFDAGMPTPLSSTLNVMVEVSASSQDLTLVRFFS